MQSGIHFAKTVSFILVETPPQFPIGSTVRSLSVCGASGMRLTSGVLLPVIQKRPAEADRFFVMSSFVLLDDFSS